MTKKYSVIMFLCILGCCSCKKDQITVANPKVDIYVAGQVNGLAAYWKNDSLVYLTGGTFANSIVISGNDVYVAGRAGNKATYWKNGVEGQALKHFGNFPTGANSIAVSGNDVYIAGWGLVFGLNGNYEEGSFWKNDSLVKTANYTYSSSLASIAI